MSKATGKKFLSDLKLYSDYLKWKPEFDRYETWNEACEDIVDGHRKKFVGVDLEEEFASALESMKEMRVFASQRTLQFRAPQIERSNLRVYNCSVLHAVKNTVFQETFYLGLNGCGVGISLLIPFIKNLSNIQKRNNGTKTFIIPDTIEGWSDSLGVLMSSYFVDDQPFPEYAGYEIKFDYSLIRPKGAFLSGGFKAPGPDGLKASLDKIESLIENWIRTEGSEIRPILCYDIICHASDSVLSGSVRRSALIMLLDPNDEEMMGAKTGNWRQSNPQRARSNNSVLIRREDDNRGFFDRVVGVNDGDSDLGFMFCNSWLDMGNPCMEISFTPVNTQEDVTAVGYHNLETWVRNNIDLFGVQMCVSGNTKLITKDKIGTIKEFVENNQEIEIWNGQEWSTVKPVKTAINQKLYRVYINDGSYLDVNAHHKFLIKWRHQKKFIEKTTLELIEMMLKYKSRIQVPRFKMIYSGGVNEPKAYDYGFILGDGTCNAYEDGKLRKPFASVHECCFHLNFPFVSGEKGKMLHLYYKNQRKEYFNVSFNVDYEFAKKMKYEEGLPREIFTWDEDSIINFFAGWIDTDGTITYNNKARIYGEEQKVRDAQLLLTKIGINCSVNLMSKKGEVTNFGIRTRDVWYVQFNNCEKLWCTKAKFTNKEEQSKGKYQLIKKIEELDGLHDTYCFEEFKLHQGVFNNILTKQCNLTSMNAEKMTSHEIFLRSCRDAAFIGTLQAAYTDFPYLSKSSENITRREALLGVSMTGWMNNPKMFDAELLRAGSDMVKETNKKIASKIGINPAARTTCVKPEGNLSVIAQTSSGIHPEHSERYFRIMQLNKGSDTAKWLESNMSFLLEESVWSASKTDYVVFIPVTNPKGGLFKEDVKGLKHLGLIRLVQENWVMNGTNKDLGISDNINHNVSATVIIDDRKQICDYIWNNKEIFTGVSFISDYGDKDFNQAPFTSVLTYEEIIGKYGKGALFASGLIVDGLHYFGNNLWQACDCVKDKTIPVGGTREEALLRKSWLSRAKKFARNYFKGDLTQMVYCLKDIHLFHKWETINRQMKEVDFSKILTKPEYKDISNYAAIACSGGSCSLDRI